MPLPTAVAVRDIGLKGLQTTGSDTRIDTLVSAADALIAAYLRVPRGASGVQTLEASSYTIYPAPEHFRPDIDGVVLPVHEIASITSVAGDIAGDWSYSDTWSSSTDYLHEVGTKRLYRRPLSTKAWPTGTRSLRVVASCGWDVGDDPVLTLAIATQVAHWWSTPGSTPPNVGNLSQGGTSVTMNANAALLPVVKEMVSSRMVHARGGHGGR